MKQRFLTFCATMVAMCMVGGCDDSSQSTESVSRSDALSRLPFRYNLPVGATDVRYMWRSGGTQDWECWLTFRCDFDEIEKIMNKELNYFFIERDMESEAYVTQSLPVRDVFQGTVSPSWWSVDEIRSGLFVGLRGRRGPRVWFDVDSGTAYVYDSW